MMRLEIYPEVWDRRPEEGRDNLGIVVGRGYGLMISIT
jgi:hypothetical protein